MTWLYTCSLVPSLQEMKKIGFIGVLLLTLWSCSTEEIEQESFIVPGWLVGKYMGVHTQAPLSISQQGIQFQINQEFYDFQISPVVQTVETELSITFYFGSEVLVFNKTTFDSEVNLKYNDLHLGWFRKRDIK